MFPEDRVLVGVIQRKKDLKIAQTQGWYRIPEGKATKGLYAEYVALFLSRSFGKQNGGVHYYARRTGFELATRADLLPDEADHPRAQERYHKLQFRELQSKVPPILNQHKRRFSFIHTTWDRFVKAKEIDDLYSAADHLVDRVFYALRDAGFRPQRRWEQATDRQEYPTQRAQVRILCEDGEVLASPYGDEGIHITADRLQQSVEQIKAEIQNKGGAKMLPIPVEY